MNYPQEFLGRCQTCLGNCFLNDKPCLSGYGNGMPLRDEECMVRRTQQQYDKDHVKKAKP